MKKLLGFLLSIVLLGACTSRLYYTSNPYDKMKAVKLGMDKAEVIGIMGDKYIASSSSKDQYSKLIEILGYKIDDDEEYKLRFVDNKLVEWNREHFIKYKTPDPVIIKQ